jgi:hypothetical protein
MEKYFLPHDLALELKELGFNESCLGKFYYNQLEIGGNWCNNDFKEDPDIFISAPFYSQIIDFFEKEHNIFIGKTCYDDGKTPKRWVYHVDNYYVQEQSYDGAIRYAIDKIKNKQL